MNRSTAVVLIFLVIALFIVPAAFAQFEGFKASLQKLQQSTKNLQQGTQFATGDLFTNITNLTFIGAFAGFGIAFYVAILIFKGEWLEGSKKTSTIVLLAIASYFVADSAAKTLAKGLLKIGFKEGLNWAWELIMIFAFIAVVLLQKEKGHLERGIEFGIVWAVVSSFIGPSVSVIVTDANLQTALISNAWTAGLWAIGIFALGELQESRKKARERAEEDKKKRESEEKEMHSLEKIREDLRSEIRAERGGLGKADAAAGAAEATVKSTVSPDVVHATFSGLEEVIPKDHLPGLPPIIPLVNAVQIYEHYQKELAEYKRLLQLITDRYGDTAPGQEIVYINKVMTELRADIGRKEGPNYWLIYVGVRRDRAAHAEEIEKFGNPGAKEVGRKLRKLAAESPTIKAILDTIKALNRRMKYLLAMKQKTIDEINKAIALKEKKMAEHVEAYRKHDEALKALNEAIAGVNADVSKFNTGLDEAHKAIIDAEKTTDVVKLREAFDAERNRITELIKQTGVIEGDQAKLESVIKAVEQGYKDINTKELEVNKVAPAEEIKRTFFVKSVNVAASTLLEAATLGGALKYGKEGKPPEEEAMR